MTIENLILDGQIRTLFSENITLLSEMKMLSSLYIESDPMGSDNWFWRLSVTIFK